MPGQSSYSKELCSERLAWKFLLLGVLELLLLLF